MYVCTYKCTCVRLHGCTRIHTRVCSESQAIPQARAEEVLLRLANNLVAVGAAESGLEKQPKLQRQNRTLKWTTCLLYKSDIDVSLYLAETYDKR